MCSAPSACGDELLLEPLVHDSDHKLASAPNVLEELHATSDE